MTTEATTRQKMIDLRLKQANWDVDDSTLVRKELPILSYRENGSDELSEAQAEFNANVFSDYALLGKNGKEIVKFGPEHESLSIAQYKELLERKITELTANNPVLQKIRDQQAPFTVLHPSGIRGIFQPAEINEILALTESLVA